jgi:autotransporter-associated beta strand protein
MRHIFVSSALKTMTSSTRNGNSDTPIPATFTRWVSSAMGLIASTAALLGQQPDNYIYTAPAGSFWNFTDPNWNGDEAWENNNGAEFSGTFNGREITLQQDISATYLHFKGTALTGNPAEFTLRGDGNRLFVYQIIATAAADPDFSDEPTPVATFRDMDVILGGGGLGTPVIDSELEVHNYRAQVLMGQQQSAPTLHFREGSSLLGALGIHSWQEGTVSGLGAEIHFHDTSVFYSLGIANGSQHFFNTSSLVMELDRHPVTGGQRFFHNESTLDIRWPGGLDGFYDSSIMGGEHTFYDSSVMNANTTYAVRRVYGSEDLPQFTFYDSSRLNVAAIGAILDGSFEFHESSAMEVADGTAGGIFKFHQSASLNVLQGGVIETDASLRFNDQSELNIFSEGGLVREHGFQWVNTFVSFNDESVLNAEVGQAVGDVNIDFHGTSTLNANARFAVVAPTEDPQGVLTFYENSTLNALVLESITGGRQEFEGNSTFNAHVMFSVQESTQIFSDNSIMNAMATGSVNAGKQTYHDNSQLNVLASGGVAGSELIFHGTSSLEAEVTGALQQDNLIQFHGNSSLNVNAANALSNGTLDFHDDSILNANAIGAIGGGEKEFWGTSVLNAGAADSISGGTQIFRETSSLNANSGSSITGGVQTFRGSSTLTANHSWAVEGGEQSFFDTSTFNADRSNSINGGTQFFRDESILNLSEKAISNGGQTFVNGSRVNATARDSIFGGSQFFTDDSILVVEEQLAISGGAQTFAGNSTFNALHADAISGGTQFFTGSSKLNAISHSLRSSNEIAFHGNSSLNAVLIQSVSGSSQVFSDSATLNVFASIGITGGTQTFYKTSVLNLNGANAITGGTQTFYEGATVNVNASNGLSSDRQYIFPHSTVLNANADFSITNGTQGFYDGAVLNANAANALAGGQHAFFDSSSLNVNAQGAISGIREYEGANGLLNLAQRVGLLEQSTLNINVSHGVGVTVPIVAGDESTINALASNSIAGFSALSGDLMLNALFNDPASLGINEVYLTGSSILNLAAGSAMSGGVVLAGESSTININAASGFAGGRLFVLPSNISVNAGATGAITGGEMRLEGTSRLNVQADEAISGGFQIFYDQSSLQALHSSAIDGGIQRFWDNSTLEVEARYAITGGTQEFLNASQLNADVSDAVFGGAQVFNATSRLNASVDWAVNGGQQTFNDSAALHATSFSAVRGGTQTFYDNSVFRANADRTLLGGTQNFHENSRLEVLNSSTGAIDGGTQNFHDDSVLYTAWRETITAGTQNFHDDSRLIAQGNTAINGGTQNFYNSSRLEAIGVPAANAVRSGAQNFYDTSSLVAARAGAVTGGTQTFYNKSTLYASVAGSVNGVEVQLHHGARLEIGVANALSTNTRVSFQNPQEDLPGGTLALNGFHTAVGALRSATAGSGRIENKAAQAATLTVNFTTPSVAFSGTIHDGEESAALSIIKANTGAWVLSGENTWTGGTTIQGGRIVAAHDSALGTGSILVQANGTLAAAGKRTLTNDLENQGLVAGDANGEILTLSGDLSGAGGFSGNIELAGTFNPGNSPALIEADGNLTFSDLHALRMEIGGLERGTEFDAFDLTGTLQLGGHLQVALIDSYSPHNSASFALFDAGLLQGSFSSYDFSQASLTNSKLAWDISQLSASGQLLIVMNPFYKDEDPEGSLNMFRTEDGTWIANAPSDYAGEVLIEDATVQISHNEALGSGEITVAEGGRLESEGGSVLANDIVNQGTIAGPDAEGEEQMRLEGDVSGDGSYEGNIEFAGSFSPGNSPSLIEADGNLTFDEMNTLIMEIGGLTRGSEYDAFDVTGTLTLGGHFVLSLLDDFVPQIGQSYFLFDAGTLEGAFASFDFTLAPLQSGLFWDTSNLESMGTLAVSAVPEPSGFVPLCCGNGCFAVCPKTGGYAAASLSLRFQKGRKQRCKQLTAKH